MGLFQMREIEKRLEAGEPESELAALRARVAELEVVLRAAIAVCDAHKDKSMWEYHGSIDALTDACSPMRDVPSAGAVPK